MHLMYFFFFALLPLMAIPKEQCRLEIQKWPNFREIHDTFTTAEFYKRQYDLALSLANYQESPRIPKIIHQIWLGSPVPKKFQDLMQTWKQKHPDWQYILWTDKDIGEFKLVNEAAYNLAPNYGMKSDILRYEILLRYGGLYIDTDQEAVIPHDIFHHITDFYIGFFHDNDDVVAKESIGNGVIGACKGHFLLHRVLSYIRSSTLKIIDIKGIGGDETLAITGPYMIKNLLQYLLPSMIRKNPSLPFLVLPKPFFYPLDVIKHEYKLLPLSQGYLTKYLFPFTYGIQYHTTAWIEL
jgi:hypothetical protein